MPIENNEGHYKSVLLPGGKYVFNFKAIRNLNI